MIENDGNALLVPVTDELTMAVVLGRLIKDPALLEQFENAALLFAKENFSNITMFGRYKNAFLF